MAYDLATAQTMYDEYINAEKAVLKNQSYSIGDKKLQRADLIEIRKGRDYWKAQLDIANPDNPRKSGIKVKQVKFNYVS